MAVTFRDVAKLAGVSTQTVSRVTNGSEQVSEETREKVNQAIKALGYIPNKSAQMLSRAKSNTLGIVSLDISLHGVALTTNGIRHQAREMGYGTALSIIEQISFSAVQKALRELISQQADHIVVNVPLDQETAEQLAKQYQHLKLIFIDVPKESAVNYVSIENGEGGRIAARHLMECNRQDFLLITGPEESTASRIRAANWLQELTEAKIKPRKVYTGNWEPQAGYLAVRDAIANKIHFDAVLVANDQMAIGVLCALNELEINIPDQVAVIGFDDTHDSAFFTPPLTTIRQQFAEVGKQAVKLLLTEISDLDQNAISPWLQKTLEVELVVRKSTSIKSLSNEATLDKQKVLKKLDELRAMLS